MNIRKHLRVFHEIISEWNETQHIVIGGLYALHLHGLVVRETADLDLVIYQPTEEFVNFLTKELTTESGSTPNTEDSEGNKWRSYKLTKDGFTIDFILEHEQELPKNLLVYHWKDLIIPVQSVAIVIAAKKDYNRPKDVLDFKTFKRDNF